ncbi:MAG: hypothetical protein JNK19_06800 [Tabrizicola sp.]|nr:hypothetical protein [Tabrizicola sp.]
MTRYTTACLPAVVMTAKATLIALGATSLLSQAAMGQAFRSDVLGASILHETKIEASNVDVVHVLAGIGAIRADLQLGLLFLQEDMTRPEGSHFLHPRHEGWPRIKDTFIAAGGADIEPLLVALEGATDKEAVLAAYQAVEKELAKGRSALQPTSADVLLALHEMVTDAEAAIDPSGITAVADYQNAWSIIMVARGELDFLARDPAIAKIAAEQAMAFDDLIISLPDPHQSAPVAVDPALFKALLTRIEELNEAA